MHPEYDYSPRKDFLWPFEREAQLSPYLCVDAQISCGICCNPISPLKALANNIHKNLSLPLQEIRQLAEQKGIHIPEIRIALRTGDTPTDRKDWPHYVLPTHAAGRRDNVQDPLWSLAIFVLDPALE
jgi:hypothetical protein